MSLSYQKLLRYLRNQYDYPINIKSNYTVINIPETNFHVTIFKDQWDDYHKVSRLPYYLFHISSDDSQNTSNAAGIKCSSYFWVDKRSNKIKNIPRKYFKYNQPTFDFFSSTRSPCRLRDIRYLLMIFQKILFRVSKVR